MKGKLFKKNRKLFNVLLIVLTVVVVAAGTIGVLAKYRAEQIRQAELISAGFHISSDYLTEEGKSYEITNMTDPISITLYNYELENVSLISQVPIEYTVTVTGGNCAEKTGTLDADQKNSKVLTIQPNAKAKSVSVEVNTTSPFSYTLKAEFRLSAQPESVNYERITENGDYYLVKIYTGQNKGEMKLNWTDGLIPDNTNELMRDWSGAEGTFTAESYRTYELIFFNPNGIEKDKVSFKLN